MISIKRILCPVDLSECSDRSLGLASSLAKWYGATIEILHVRSPEAPAPAGSGDTTAPDPAAGGLDDLTELVKSCGVPVEVVQEQGNPATEILHRLEVSPADLLVMGTHGRGGFERWALGSVAEKVLRRAGCPVLTVPPRLDRSPKEGRGIFQRILCPLDFSDPSLAALEFAFSLAKESYGRILLFHCTEAMTEEDAPELLRFDLTRFRKDLEEAASRRLTSILPAGFSEWCKAEILVTSGKPYREILTVSQERESDVIVMGIHGRRPFDGSLFGSTTQQVVRRASCPVLTIGPKKHAASRSSEREASRERSSA